MHDEKFRQSQFLREISALTDNNGYKSILPSLLDDDVIESMIVNIQAYLRHDIDNPPIMSVPLYYVAKLAGRNTIEGPEGRAMKFSETQLDLGFTLVLIALLHESDCRVNNIIHPGSDSIFLNSLDQIFV
jgi:hypothetical protein